MSKRLLICMVRDDITNLFLLYRKLALTSFDIIGIYACHSTVKAHGLLNQDITRIFPKLAFLGPSLLYEAYITMANFPHTIDLEKYNMNMVNVDLIGHLSDSHIKDIFPKQKTDNRHPLHIMKEDFLHGTKHVIDGEVNIGINFMDVVYDKEGILVPELPIIISKLENRIRRKPVIHIFGIGSQKLQGAYMSGVREFIGTKYEIVNCMDKTYSEQLGIICNLNLLVSGPFTWGYLTYVTQIPTIVVYPYYLSKYFGKTSGFEDGNPNYVEILDDDIPFILDDRLEELVLK